VSELNNKRRAALVSPPERRLSPGDIAQTLAFTLGLARQADRRRFQAVATWQLLHAVGLSAVLLLLRNALRAGLPGITGAAGATHLAPMISGLAVAGTLSLIAAIGGLIMGAQQRVLTLEMNALALDRVAAAATAADLRTFEDSAFHDRVEQATTAAREYLGTVLTRVITALGTALNLIAVGATFAAMAWWLLPVLLLAALPAVQVTLARHRGDFALHQALLENGRASSYLTTLLTGRDAAKEVRAFDLAEILRARLADRYATTLEQRRCFERSFLARQIRARLAGDLTLAATVAVIVALTSTGRLDTVSAITTLGATVLLSGQLQNVSSTISSMGSILLSLDALRGFITTAPPTEPAPKAATFTTLSTHQVSFTYPTATRPALADISLSVHAGEVIALVGANGSGKTTLAKVLTGLYRPDTGTVMWDGEPLDDPTRLRAAATVLFQDFARYKLSATDNIGFGRPDHIHDTAAITDAAQRAGAHAFLNALPAQYATVLSTEFTDGADLSVGQWQRLALARAYFRDAPFLVLDEPTAALDPQAEADLFAHMRQLYADRTVLLITHRFSSVRHADRIYVLADGKIIEEGTHEHLMTRHGTYAHLFLTQASAYLDPPATANTTAAQAHREPPADWVAVHPRPGAPGQPRIVDHRPNEGRVVIGDSAMAHACDSQQTCTSCQRGA
jgi:ATP-binding cassette subfamily B protein